MISLLTKFRLDAVDKVGAHCALNMMGLVLQICPLGVRLFPLYDWVGMKRAKDQEQPVGSQSPNQLSDRIHMDAFQIDMLTSSLRMARAYHVLHFPSLLTGPC